MGRPLLHWPKKPGTSRTNSRQAPTVPRPFLEKKKPAVVAGVSDSYAYTRDRIRTCDLRFRKRSSPEVKTTWKTLDFSMFYHISAHLQAVAISGVFGLAMAVRRGFFCIILYVQTGA
jgi:hypothetical protein